MRTPVRITLAAAAIMAVVAGCGQAAAQQPPAPSAPAPVSGACVAVGDDCPLGHAYKQYGKTFGDGVTATYTVSADRAVTSAAYPGDGTTIAGRYFLSVKFTIRGLAGDGGTNDSAGMEATVTGSDGRTYFGDDDTMVTFDPTPGSLTTGWVTFKAMPDGVTATAITWGNADGHLAARERAVTTAMSALPDLDQLRRAESTLIARLCATARQRGWLRPLA